MPDAKGTRAESTGSNKNSSDEGGKYKITIVEANYSAARGKLTGSASRSTVFGCYHSRDSSQENVSGSAENLHRRFFTNLSTRFVNGKSTFSPQLGMSVFDYFEYDRSKAIFGALVEATRKSCSQGPLEFLSMFLTANNRSPSFAFPFLTWNMIKSYFNKLF